jgi:maltose O-acetyltransferase
VWKVLREEFGSLHPRLALANLFIGLMPQLAFQRLRTALYRLAGITIGPRTLIAARLDLIGPGRIASHLNIGADCYLNAPIFFDLTGSVAIGDHVTIGHHTTFITANHAIGPEGHRAGPVSPAPIVVGSGTWIGAGVTLLPGSIVGPGSVIGAGSLVVGDVPAGVLAVGKPAQVLRDLTLCEATVAAR